MQISQPEPIRALTIRPLRREDADAAATLKARRIRETFICFGEPDQVEVEVANVATPAFMERAAEDPEVIFLTAWSGDDLLGIGGIRFFEDLDPLVFSGFSAPGSRAGGELLRVRIKILESMGCARIRSFVFSLNRLGVAHLHRAGFAPAGLAPAARSIPQVPVEEWVLALPPATPI